MEDIEQALEPAEPTPEPKPEPQALVFTGKYGEYFRIWLLNLALSIITLGIYSPWAKVRRLEYFWRNTRLDDASFDYHGAPIAILKGRIIGLMLFAAYSLTAQAGIFFHLVALVAIAAVLPFLLLRTLKFRLHNTSYRGLRFRFSGEPAGAYEAFLGWPFLSLISLMTLAPLAHQRMKRYEHNNASFGQTPFSMDVSAGSFYAPYLAVFFGSIAILIAAGVISGVVLAATTAGHRPPPGLPPTPPGWLFALIAAAYLFAVLGSQAFLTSRITNAVWNATHLGKHRFIATVGARRVLWLTVSNVFATVATLGLFTPIAQIRMARYMTGAFVVDPGETLDHVVAADPEDVGAAGEEATGLLDFDISF